MSRIRQRFVVQQAKNIQCMKYIPGGVDQGDGEEGGGEEGGGEEGGWGGVRKGGGVG